MDYAFPLAILFIAFAAGGWWRSRFLADMRALARLITEDREPGGITFHDTENFAPLADALKQSAQRQRIARDDLRAEAINLRTILSSMDDSVMVVDGTRTIRFVNPAFLTLFRITTDPVGSATLPALGEHTFHEMIDAVLQAGEPREEEISTNGARQPRHFSVSAVPLRDAQGQPGVVIIFRDITRLRLLEEVRKEFVGNVSHELRTPLSIFQGYLETLIECPELSAADAHPMLLVMNKHSRRLNALVEDLLILARLESRDEQLRLAPLDLETFLHESVADWSLRSTEKNITLIADIAPGLPPIPADAFRLEQVLSNLIDNAIKYTDTGGSATVHASLDGDAMEISVQDNGLGIPAADLPRIFERFYRADKARSREHGGTGLGLSIVKHIVQAHGGTVRAESQQGQGTTIILRLPLKSPEPQAIRESA